MSRKQTPHRVDTTAGGFNAYLGVQNVTGIAEERGFRLVWVACDGRTQIPARGLATSNPFRTERAAKAHGKHEFGRDAIRIPSVGVAPNHCKRR